MKYLHKLFILALTGIVLGGLTACVPTAPEGSDSFSLKAKITSVGEKIEVEVYDSDYAFGTYLVITDAATTYLDENGKTISRLDLTAGDRIEIFYGGQTMQSFPPQIYSPKIVKLP